MGLPSYQSVDLYQNRLYCLDGSWHCVWNCHKTLFWFDALYHLSVISIYCRIIYKIDTFIKPTEIYFLVFQPTFIIPQLVLFLSDFWPGDLNLGDFFFRVVDDLRSTIIGDILFEINRPKVSNNIYFPTSNYTPLLSSFNCYWA